jgi:hypothetical protein
MKRLSGVLWGLLFLVTACGGPGSAAVAAVQLQTTNVSPRVGETMHVGATPVDANGRTVTGVACQFASSNPAVAAVDSASGAVSAISPGLATITASCAGKQSSVDITVRPNEVTLTIQKAGDGDGAVFANPPGTPSYEPGTSVEITANANPDSIFVGWGGACAGVAADAPCELVLDNDTTVVATFALPETFVSSTWNASLGGVTDSIGCQYAVSASGVLTFALVENSDGSVTGTASTNAHIDIVNTYTPPYDTCTALPFDIAAMGPISGNDGQLGANLSSSGGSFTMTFAGARNGATIHGSATVDETLRDGSGTPYPVSGGTGGFALNQQ